MELLQQGSDAALALQVEIIPREILGLTGDSEARYSYKEYTGENKLARQLKGNPPAQGKGGWKESSKDPPSIRRRGRKEGTVSIRSPRMEKEFPSHGSWSPRSESLNMTPLDEGSLCGVECGRRSAPGSLPSKGGSLVSVGLFCLLSPWWVVALLQGLGLSLAPFSLQDIIRRGIFPLHSPRVRWATGVGCERNEGKGNPCIDGHVMHVLLVVNPPIYPLG
jgi:hypothetical protein